MSEANDAPGIAVTDDDLRLAVELGEAAAAVAMAHFRRGVTTTLKADMTPVTQADLDVEALLRRELARRRPDDAVVGEEEGGTAAVAGRTWIIDPVDGTKNFAAGIPVWATLIGIVVAGRPRAGVVAAPAIGEFYAGRTGAGATFNGMPISVSATATIRETFLLDGGVDELLASEWGDAYLRLARSVRRTRGFGDFWSHTLVARGAADAALEPRLRIWDYAAVQAIVEAAGGQVTTFGGGATTDGAGVLSSNGRVHDALITALAEPAGSATPSC